jgi:glycerol-3-phosphate O-acyltransferase
MSAVLRRLLSLWVRADVRPEEAVAGIGAVPGAPVCYVLERRSRTDLATLANVCAAHALPAPGGRILGRGGRAVRASLPLLQPRGLFDARLERRPPEALVRMIEALHADPGFDVRLVPTAVYWGRAPQKEGSWLRLLLAEDYSLGGSLRKFLQVIFNGRFTMIEVGQPISLRGLLEPGVADATLAARIARTLRAQFRRQRAARIGPDLSHRRTIVMRVLRTRAVRTAVAQEMRDRKLDRRRAMRVAQGYAEEIAANYSHPFVTFMAGLLARLWNRLYDGVSFEHAATLQDAAKDHEVVYVPCHRSHMDYLLLSYAIYRQGYAIPHIAAGINLNIPVIGRFLRKGGAFFIRRSFAGNALYTVVFMKYLATIMARGHSIEYFVEGGRSRTGRLLQPKTGMMSMTVRSFLRDPVRPVVFLPVYFGYERIVEANTYIGELSGRPKEKESWLDLLRALRVLREKFGRVHVNLGAPIELDAILDRHEASWRSIRFDDDTRAGWVSRAVDDLAEQVMQGINSAAAVTPVNLLAITLLATPRQVMAEADLLRQIDLYLALLRAAPYSERVTVTPLSAAEVVHYGEQMKILERQAHKLGDILRMSEQNAVLMAYYRNNVLHLFAMPSLIACAFISNAVMRTEDIQRLVWRIYPYICAELFLRWSETDLPGIVERMLRTLAELGIIEAVNDGAAWRRPAPTSPRAIQLSLLAQATIQTIERYYLAIALLMQAGSGQINARTLAERCQLMAQRITMIYGFNSPEFSDRSMFENFVERLLARGVLRADPGGLLAFDEVLIRTADDAEIVLSEQLRHSILQVAHT